MEWLLILFWSTLGGYLACLGWDAARQTRGFLYLACLAGTMVCLGFSVVLLSSEGL